MTNITTTEEPAAPRAGLFYGTVLAATVIGLAALIGGGTVKPLLDVPAIVEQVSDGGAAQAPAGPGTPVQPAVTPTPTQAADGCTAPADDYATRVCDAAQALGWIVTGAVKQGQPFTATILIDGKPMPPLVMGRDQTVPYISDRYSITFYADTPTTTRAGITPLPAQSTANVAEQIRTALGVSEIWFMTDGDIVDGPSIAFGSGWSVATLPDASRKVGDSVYVMTYTLSCVYSDTDGVRWKVN